MAEDMRFALLALSHQCRLDVAEKQYRELGFLKAYRGEMAEKDAEIAKLRAVCEESNAVCVCGCPANDHENYGEAEGLNDLDVIAPGRLYVADWAVLNTCANELDALREQITARCVEKDAEIARLRNVLGQIAALDKVRNDDDRPPIPVALDRWHQCVMLAKKASR